MFFIFELGYFRGEYVMKYILFMLFVFQALINPQLASSGQQGDKADYRIGIGDSMSISVRDNESLSANVTVRPDGKISFYLIDDVYVEGLTPIALKEILIQNLKPFVSNPDVTIIISQIRSIDVYVLGEVIKPGNYNLNKTISILHLLSLAGGIKLTADIDAAFLLRDKKKISIDFYKLIYEGDLSQNITLKGYDLLYFPDNKNKNITVLGEVKNPSVIPFRKGLSIMNVIVHSGGMTGFADSSKVKVIRKGKTIYVDIKKILKNKDLTQNITMFPDDMVIVPKSLF